MGEHPTGTVTFLFTDVVGSSRLWAQDESAMSASLRAHDETIREAIERHGGYIFTTAGDAFCAAFERDVDAVRSAFGIQRRLANLDWPGPRLDVRVGVHSGRAELRAGDYFGPTVNTTARVTAAAHGGQSLFTDAVDASPAGFPVIDLGEHRLPDVHEPVHLHQLGDGEFPPIESASAPGRFVFDDFTVDVAARDLRRGGERIHLEPQVFDVLACLIEHRDRVMTHEELLDEIWGDQFVSPSALTSRIKAVRQALGDDGRTQRYVRTEHGRGYRFVGDVSIEDTPDTSIGRVGAGRQSSGDATRPTLPVMSDPLLGREDEARELGEILETTRLATLTGPGGMGKTRLSVDLARQWESVAESRNALFVALDEVRVADDVAEAVATSLGIDTSGADDVATACADWLATGERLVVLDNCEHVLTSVASFTDVVLDRAASATVLATSREPLRLAEERVYRLHPLPLPFPDDLDPTALGPCVQLFTDRAQRVDTGFDVTPENAAMVVGLCRRLDGLPLAIELAASRLGSLGLAELAETLTHRLDAIHASQRGIDERHQSLRSTIEWSYRLLPDDDTRRLLDAMARFPGGIRFTDVVDLAARIGIEGSADALLSHLVDASMLYTTETGGVRRYRMLETLRHFGTERLAEDGLDDVVDTALVDHALALGAEERRAWLEPTTAARSYRVLRDEIPNLRAARDVMVVRRDHTSLVQLSTDLFMFTEQICLGEPWSWIDEIGRVRADLDGDDDVKAELLAATADRNAGRLESAIERAERVVADGEDAWIRALAWHQIAMSRLFRQELREAADAWRHFDELTGLYSGRIFGSMALGYLGELDEAERQLDGCHVVLDGGHPYAVSGYHYVAGELARLAGSATARESFERGVATCLEYDLQFTLGINRVSLVSLLAAEGDLARAASGYVELIEQWLRSGTWPQLWITLRNVAELLAGADDATALLIWAAADVDPQATALDPESAAAIAALRAECRARCGTEAADEVERSARRTSRHDVVSRTLDALTTIR